MTDIQNLNDPDIDTFQLVQMSELIDEITNVFIKANNLLFIHEEFAFDPLDITQLQSFFKLLKHEFTVNVHNIKAAKQTIGLIRRLKRLILNIHDTTTTYVDSYKTQPTVLIPFLIDALYKTNLYVYKLEEQRNFYFRIIETVKNTSEKKFTKADSYPEPPEAVKWLDRLVKAYLDNISEERIKAKEFLVCCMTYHTKFPHDELQHLIYVCDCMFGGISMKNVQQNFNDWMKQYYYGLPTSIRKTLLYCN